MPTYICYRALCFQFVDVIPLARVPLGGRLWREIADFIGIVRQHRPTLLDSFVVPFVLLGPVLFALYPFLAFGAALVTLRHVMSLPLRAGPLWFDAENQMQDLRRVRLRQEAEAPGRRPTSTCAYRRCFSSCNGALVLGVGRRAAAPQMDRAGCCARRASAARTRWLPCRRPAISAPFFQRR